MQKKETKMEKKRKRRNDVLRKESKERRKDREISTKGTFKKEREERIY